MFSPFDHPPNKPVASHSKGREEVECHHSLQITRSVISGGSTQRRTSIDQMLVSTSGSRPVLTVGGDGDRLHLSLSQLLITASTLIYPQWNDVIRRPAEWRQERQMTENAEDEEYESLTDNGVKQKS